jgi:hypothetical protein
MDVARLSGAGEGRMSALRSLSFVFVVGAASAVGGSACSGAETQDVLARQVGASSSSGITSSSSGGSSGVPSGSSSGGTSSTSGATSGTTPGNCTPEEEPNDNRNTANVLDPARCGTLGRNDQKDFLTFQLKPTTKNMSLNFSGRIRMKVEVGGRTVELTPDDAGMVPFMMGEQYHIEVTSLTDSNNEEWRVAVVEN